MSAVSEEAIAMDAARWQRIRTLFDAVAEQPAMQRVAALAALCPDDASLRNEVLALLAADSRSGERSTRLEHEVPGLVAAYGDDQAQQLDDRWIGRRLGRWRLLEAIGRGGMGRVYRAERDDGEYRQVAAIKRIATTVHHDELVLRFRTERQILAGLQHPHIASLIDGGVDDEGMPWFALELVDGIAITDWCARNTASLDQRLSLFLDICAAVQHAHDRLVVHRDLKPSNLLVDTEGRVKLLDFGIARLVENEPGLAATGTGRHLFTPEYAAPEQLCGELPTIAVDIYALGLILHELLLGRHPHAQHAGSPGSLIRAVVDEDASPPSLSWSRVTGRDADGAIAHATRLGLSPGQLRQRLTGDLDAIVIKALRRDPGQRYGSVRALADDVQAALEHRPVSARHGHRGYRLRCFLRRHAFAVAASVAIVLALLTGLGAALWQRQEALAQRDLAVQETAKAEQILAFMLSVFEDSRTRVPATGEVTARQLLQRASTRIEDELVGQPVVRAALLEAMARAYQGIGLPGEAHTLSAAAIDLRGRLGDRHALGTSLIRHATSLQNAGQREQALAALDEARPLLDPAHSATPLLLAEIEEAAGLAHLGEGRWIEAERHFRSALDAYAVLLGTEHRQWVQSVMGLARALAGQDRHTEADTLFAPVVERLRDAGPEQEALLVRVLDTHGQLLFRQQRWAETEVVREETLALAERQFGPDNWSTLIASNNVGVARLRQHKYAEALAPLSRAVAGAEAILPPEHGFTFAALFNLAEAEAGLGQWPQALARYEALHDYLERNPDVRQPDRHAVLAQIARGRQALTAGSP